MLLLLAVVDEAVVVVAVPVALPVALPVVDAPPPPLALELLPLLPLGPTSPPKGLVSAGRVALPAARASAA